MDARRRFVWKVRQATSATSMWQLHLFLLDDIKMAIDPVLQDDITSPTADDARRAVSGLKTWLLKEESKEAMDSFIKWLRDKCQYCQLPYEQEKVLCWTGKVLHF